MKTFKSIKSLNYLVYVYFMELIWDGVSKISSGCLTPTHLN